MLSFITVRILTNESVVHSQMATIRKLLDGDKPLLVNLNRKGATSNIQFEIKEDELTLLSLTFGDLLYAKRGTRWTNYSPGNIVA